MNNATILIQGPAHLNSINNIDRYNKYGNVVYSTWSPQNDSEKNYIKILKENKFVNLIINNTELINKIILGTSVYNHQNIFKQSTTTHAALSAIDTDFTIKLRSDEKYENLQPLLDKIKNNPHKIITSNIFFRQPSLFLYHVSDHIIAGNTKNLFNIYNNMITFCIKKKFETISKYPLRVPIINNLVAEQIFTVCSIPILSNNLDLTKTLYNNIDICKQYIKTHFDIIDVNLLGKYIISYTDRSARNFCFDVSNIQNKKTDIIYSIEEY